MSPRPERIRHAAVAAVFLLSLLVLSRSANADPITLMWDANAASQNVVGYTIYVGTQAGVYTQTIDVGNSLSYVYPDAIAGRLYYFAVAAYSAGPALGPRSSEVSGWSNAPPSLINPGSRTNIVGSAIAPLQLAGSDPLGEPVSYTATGLPPGLTLQTSTGLIAGTGTTAGVYNVTATVRDGALPPLTDAKTFAWTMTAPATSVALTPDPAMATTLTATVTNGPGNATDWLGLFPEGAADAAFSSWCYLNGTQTPAAGMTSALASCFTPPSPGRFQVRLFANNTFTKVATSNTITVLAPPVLNITDVTKAEGQSGTTNFVFAVSLSPASPMAATVQYATANRTATAGSDYTAASGTLTFAAGVTTRNITVTVTGDTTAEAAETFAVVLSQPANASIGDGEGIGTITNDDGAPATSVALTPDPVAMGATLTAAITGAPGNATDWIALFPEGAADTAFVSWCYLNGTKTAAAGMTNAVVPCLTPPAPGRYQARLFANNGFTKLATSNTITVSAPAGPVVALTPDPAAVGATLTATVTGGPGNPTDWLALYAEGADDSAFTAWCYLNGTKTPPAGMTGAAVTCFTALAPGRYQVRLFASNGFTRLAVSNTITVPAPSGPRVVLTPDPATVGAALSAAVTGGPGNAMDWIGLFAEGAGDTEFAAWCYLNGTKTPPTGMTSATVSCFTPLVAGRYQVRLFASNSFTKLATSNTVTVR